MKTWRAAVWNSTTNGSREKIRVSLGRTGLLTRLEGRLVSRKNVANPKPAPDVYLRGAEILGVAAGGCCFVIKDSPNRAQTAKAAGMVCPGYVAATDAGRMRQICDGPFTRMDEPPGMLGL